MENSLLVIFDEIWPKTLYYSFGQILKPTCVIASSMSSSRIVALFFASLFALMAAIFSTDIVSLSGLI